MTQTISPAGFSESAATLQATESTTIFISGASNDSNGRCSYMLSTDDGGRQWLPNIQRLYLLSVSEVTQTYESYDPQPKLLVKVTTAATGDCYCYRIGLTSFTATGFLTGFSQLSDAELKDQIEVTLKPGSRGNAVFVNLATVCPEGNAQSVRLPKELLGKKLEYTEAVEQMAALQERLTA